MEWSIYGNKWNLIIGNMEILKMKSLTHITNTVICSFFLFCIISSINCQVTLNWLMLLKIKWHQVPLYIYNIFMIEICSQRRVLLNALRRRWALPYSRNDKDPRWCSRLRSHPSNKYAIQINYIRRFIYFFFFKLV